jgi:hypothetical protein
MEAFLTKEASMIDENVHALDKVGFFMMSCWSDNSTMWFHEQHNSYL